MKTTMRVWSALTAVEALGFADEAQLDGEHRLSAARPIRLCGPGVGALSSSFIGAVQRHIVYIHGVRGRPARNRHFQQMAK